jgi:hypothetical protein
MPTISESRDNQSPLAGVLHAGVETLSGNQTVLFTQYVKLVLPLDKYVFWVRADLVSEIEACNCYKCNPSWIEGTPAPALTFEAKGSLHFATSTRQAEDETASINSVVFTSEQAIQNMNSVSANVMYIGEYDGKKFAFNHRELFYQQAGLWHYEGDALYPALASQIVDDLKDFDTSNLVVSNSLPIWLSLNAFMPMYPSFLVDENIEPPYAAVHIDPSSTEAIGAAPFLDKTYGHSQLVREKVKITLYGLRNFSALDFQDYVFQFTLDNPDVMGISSMPVIRDEKRIQSEMSILAQKKTFELEVNYYQHRARNVARQLILKCIPTVILG